MAKKAAAKRAAKKASKTVTNAAAAKKVANRSTKRAAAQVAAPAPEIDARALLLADVRGFNMWRKANLGAPIDLTGADLRGANLRDAFLAGARLDGAMLDDAALAGALLSGASLVGASLKRADVRGVCFGPLELIEASLAMSPVGRSLMSGASLRGASMAAARAQQAVFREADLGDVDLTDCDLTDADLKRANMDGARQGPPPPGADDTEGMLARLATEPRDVREGMGLFGVLVFLSGDRTADGNQLLAAIGEGIGLGVAELQGLVPPGRIVLEAITATPPASDWARRVYFALMCGLASTSTSVVPTQLQVLGHFGAMYGLSNRAMTRIIGEELGVALTGAD